MKATAIVLSAAPVDTKWAGWETLNHVSVFNTLEGLHKARLDAVKKVTTEFCAFVDSDDELPKNTGEQIAEIIAKMEERHSNLTYTDWIERRSTGEERRMSPGEYNFAKHVTNITWMHQLVVMRTEAAQAWAQKIPQGAYWTEIMLYAKLAETNPIYYPNVAYVWNRGATGMHTHPGILKAQTAGVQWYLTKGRK